MKKKLFIAIYNDFIYLIDIMYSINLFKKFRQKKKFIKENIMKNQT